jgi:hypothetical protein
MIVLGRQRSIQTAAISNDDSMTSHGPLIHPTNVAKQRVPGLRLIGPQRKARATFIYPTGKQRLIPTVVGLR